MGLSLKWSELPGSQVQFVQPPGTGEEERIVLLTWFWRWFCKGVSGVVEVSDSLE
jgi:hypothetical protein